MRYFLLIKFKDQCYIHMRGGIEAGYGGIARHIAVLVGISDGDNFKH
jgi:hypothetical protein